MIRVAINGFGRIGRMVFRKCIEERGIEVVAINASYPVETLVHLTKYDSVHGRFAGEIETDGEHLIVNGKNIPLYQKRDPKQLPWKDAEVDIVVEATGQFTTREGASKHLEAGAKKVIITAPGTDEDMTIVYGVNHHEYQSENHHIISNASCTTNCLAPVVKVIHDSFGIETGIMTTVHSYTNDQRNIDNPHKDLRRARACGQSIIPTTTGAAKAIGKVLPELDGKLHGMALRVPTPNVSLVDLVATVRVKTTVSEINEALKRASQQSMSGVLTYTNEPLVSTDFIGNSHSSIIDGLSTLVVSDKQIKIIAWYDNEWGYSCRVVDLLKHVGGLLHKKIEASVS